MFDVPVGVMLLTGVVVGVPVKSPRVRIDPSDPEMMGVVGVPVGVDGVAAGGVVAGGVVTALPISVTAPGAFRVPATPVPINAS